MKKLAVIALLFMFVGSVFAGGVKYDLGDEWVEIGGRIQLQYHRTDADEGDSSDELRFRRLRPFIEGSTVPDWKGKFQFDFGKSDVSVKDAYFEYGGFELADFTIGNVEFCFSREVLTSRA